LAAFGFLLLAYLLSVNSLNFRLFSRFRLLIEHVRIIQPRLVTPTVVHPDVIAEVVFLSRLQSEFPAGEPAVHYRVRNTIHIAHVNELSDWHFIFLTTPRKV
jgi:hypothetical protein